MAKYRFNEKDFEYIRLDERQEFFNSLKKDNKGYYSNYTDRNYTVNNKNLEFDDEIVAISVFSGAGGLDIGCQLAGVRVISSLDNYIDSVKTLSSNIFFKHTKHFCEDINTFDFSKLVDIINNYKKSKIIIIGGPPCQPFSKAGYWVTNDKRDSFHDERNLMKQYFELIEYIKPSGVILENVESILHPSNFKTVEFIKEMFYNLGYCMDFFKIKSSEYGIPQKRNRVFFIAKKNKRVIDFNSYLTNEVSVLDWIAPFGKDEEYDEGTTVTGKWANELYKIPPGKNYIALSARNNYPNPPFIAGKRYWSSLLKLDPNLPSWTIIASPGHWEGPFHWENRRLTNKEAAAIQTFPKDYIFYGSARSVRKQIGNAVPPLIGKMIIEELVKCL